jgi:hypothetical protein
MSLVYGKQQCGPQRVYSFKPMGLGGVHKAFERPLRRQRPFLYDTSFFVYPSSTPLSFRLLNSSGSRNLLMVTSSARPFLLLVLSTKSLASACAVAGSRGRNLISLSSGSPGTMDHRSKTRERETWPWVWIYRVVSDMFNRVGFVAGDLLSDRSRIQKNR